MLGDGWARPLATSRVRITYTLIPCLELYSPYRLSALTKTYSHCSVSSPSSFLEVRVSILGYAVSADLALHCPLCRGNMGPGRRDMDLINSRPVNGEGLAG